MFDLSSIRKSSPLDRAPLIVVHGQPGVGKTTLAAQADAPIFILTEDGLGINEVASFPVATGFDDVMSAIEALYGEHDFKTLVIDSLSALEPMIWDKACKVDGVSKIEDFGFGKGYQNAMVYWRELVAACRGLAMRGMTIVMIAHSQSVRIDPPDNDPYDRYDIMLHKLASAHLYQQSDVFGFAHSPTYVSTKMATKTQKEKSGKATEVGERMLRVVNSPAIAAKHRYLEADGDVRESIELNWESLRETIPFLKGE